MKKVYSQKSYNALRVYIHRALNANPCLGLSHPGRIARLLLHAFSNDGLGHLTAGHLSSFRVMKTTNFELFRRWAERNGVLEPGGTAGIFKPGTRISHHFKQLTIVERPSVQYATQEKVDALEQEVKNLTAMLQDYLFNSGGHTPANVSQARVS